MVEATWQIYPVITCNGVGPAHSPPSPYLGETTPSRTWRRRRVREIRWREQLLNRAAVTNTVSLLSLSFSLCRSRRAGLRKREFRILPHTWHNHVRQIFICWLINSRSSVSPLVWIHTFLDEISQPGQHTQNKRVGLQLLEQSIQVTWGSHESTSPSPPVRIR